MEWFKETPVLSVLCSYLPIDFCQFAIFFSLQILYFQILLDSVSIPAIMDIVIKQADTKARGSCAGSLARNWCRSPVRPAGEAGLDNEMLVSCRVLTTDGAVAGRQTSAGADPS